MSLVHARTVRRPPGRRSRSPQPVVAHTSRREWSSMDQRARTPCWRVLLLPSSSRTQMTMVLMFLGQYSSAMLPYVLLTQTARFASPTPPLLRAAVSAGRFALLFSLKRLLNGHQVVGAHAARSPKMLVWTFGVCRGVLHMCWRAASSSSHEAHLRIVNAGRYLERFF